MPKNDGELPAIQGRKILITIFATSDVKRRDPFEIRGIVGYIGEMADDEGTIELEIEPTSVTMSAKDAR